MATTNLWTRVALLAFTLMAMAVVGIQGRDLRVPGVSGILDLEFARTEARVQEIETAWGTSGIERAKLNIWLDFAFLAGYGLTLYFACRGAAASATSKGVAALGRWLAVAALVAAGLDVFENLAMLRGLSVDLETDLLPALWSLAARIKFALALLGIAYLIGAPALRE